MQLTSDQAHWRDVARTFAEKLKPSVDSMERNSEFPLEAMKQLGKMGVLGIPFSRDYGGSDGDTFSFVLCILEISKVWASLGLSIGAHILGANPIYFAGTEAQKVKYLVPLVKGEVLGSFGLTEPSSGSDAAGSQTKAVRSGDRFLLSGKKIFTTSANYASTFIVSAVTDKPKGKKGITAFILERDFPGLTVGKKEDKLGLWASDTSGLIMDSCPVPAENLLGAEGEGFRIFLKTLDAGRLGIAGWCIGISHAIFEEMVRWARERGIRNRLMEEFEFHAGSLAETATHVEAAELLLQEACRLKDKGEPYTKQASMAKYFASNVAVDAADMALRLFGEEALASSSPLQRYFRDAKLGTVGEGTTEIQKLVIAREVLLEAEKLAVA